MEKKRVSFFSVLLTVIEIAAVLLAILRFTAPDLFSNFRPICALVVSDSMQPVLTPGTIVGLKGYHEGDDLKEGDIITYLRKDGKTIIHRIITIGDDYVITKGDNNSIADPKVELFRIRGIVTGIHRVDSEKIQSIVRNYYAKGNTETRRNVSIGVIVLACILLVSSFFPDKKERKKKQEQTQTASEIAVDNIAAADPVETDGQSEDS